uniref:[FeFe] hydrogenase H-cluster radical SAM maturase HydE n=1 Tax=candidate division WOR-3 bacterium TaxID=2052148 RepID=A0A7C4GDY4_UNCW3
MNRQEILQWLREADEARLEYLWQQADGIRRERVGDEVHLRALIELSNYCRRDCFYCGIRASRCIERYRMSEDEVMDCARLAQRLRFGTVVLQSGEDMGLTSDLVTRLVRRIKVETGLAVTLSLGERDVEELAEWRKAGADRYLLKHETSDGGLFRRIRPGCDLADRLGLLRRARELGYEVGSGVMVGIPGQSYESLADDVSIFRELDLDMIGIGPFVAHPETPLGHDRSRFMLPEGEQVPATDLMTTKVVALARLVCPDANIPATTALATVNVARGREIGLERGANVWMPDLTPLRWRRLYDIYPGKSAGLAAPVEEERRRLIAVLAAMGRMPATGAGGRQRRRPANAG